MNVSEGFMLRVLNGELRGRVFPLPDSLDIGSGGDCGLRLRDAAVSPSHARLQRDGDGVVIEDLGSSRGTFLNDESVERASLKKGDLLRIGRTHLSVIQKTGGAQDKEATGNDGRGGSGDDSRLIQRARAAEARKVQLEKARARLTRENEELRQKLALEEVRRRELKEKPGASGGLSEPAAGARPGQEELAEELKSALEIRTRLAILLKAARKKIARLEEAQAEPGEGEEARIRSLQEEIAAAREESEKRDQLHQQELAAARISTEELEQARGELRELAASYHESEGTREDLGRKLEAKETELAESEGARAELALRLETVAEEKKLLESNRGQLEQQHEETQGLRAELLGLREELSSRSEEVQGGITLLELSQGELEEQREECEALRAQLLELRGALESLEAEKKRESEAHRGELESLVEDGRRDQEPLARRVDELEALNVNLTDELETRQGELNERIVEFEQGQASRAELQARCSEAEQARELLEGELAGQLETITAQSQTLGELEARLNEAGRELSSLRQELDRRESRLGQEGDVLRRRLDAAEEKRQDQEGRIDGLEDERLKLSGELVLLKRYADDVRRRLLEKEALADELASRLRVSSAPQKPA